MTASIVSLENYRRNKRAALPSHNYINANLNMATVFTRRAGDARLNRAYFNSLEKLNAK